MENIEKNVKVETNNVKDEKNKTLRKIVKIFWVFIIGSVIGYLLEMVVGLVQNGHFVSKQGLIYGPFSQVYGAGLVVYYLVIPKSKNWLKIFLFSMFLGGITEYVFSYMQEVFFGTVSWDYHNLWFNLNGRTSILHCIYWGIGGILFMKYIKPYLEKIDNFYNKKWYKIITVLLAIFILFDIILSGMACFRQVERKENVEAKTNIGIFLEKYYPDEVLNKIYSGAKEI